MKKSAFTLVELLISITISMLLMVSIGVFLNSGMQSLFLQQTGLQNLASINSIANEINQTLSRSQNAIINPNTHLLLNTKREFDKGGITFIGVTEQTNYCDEGDVTNHLFIKSFIPFGPSGTDTEKNQGIYTSSQIHHTIKDSSGTIIIGNGNYGNTPIPLEGISGSLVQLHSPTGLAEDSNGVLYIADTLNNRILYYFPTTYSDTNKAGKVFTLLNEYDGIVEPTDLKIIDGNLYIANSGKGEILRFSSKKVTTPVTKTFSASLSGVSAPTLARIEYEFITHDSAANIELPTNKSDYSFTNITKYEDFLIAEDNIGIYYFNDYNLEDPTKSRACIIDDGNTDTTEFLLLDGYPYKIVTDCMIDSSSGTPVATGDKKYYKSISYQNLNETETYTFEIQNIRVKSSASVFAFISLFDKDNQLLIKKLFPFIQSGDGKLYTLDDNQLEVINKNLNFPYYIGNESTFKEINPSFTVSYNQEHDTILETPIKQLIPTINSNNVLTLSLEYYRNFNCYNRDENQNKVKTFLFKKKFP